MTDTLERIIAEMREYRLVNTGSPDTDIQQWADRLAALAGAAPVAWISAKQLDSLTKMPPQLSANPRNVHLSKQHTRNRRTPLYTHAPAKAREVTEADVERALRAPYGDGDVSDMLRGGGDEETAIMRAALATFVEGEE